MRERLLAALCFSASGTLACGEDLRDVAGDGADAAMSEDAGDVEADASSAGGDGGTVGVSCFGEGLTLAVPPATFPALKEPSTNPTTLAGVALGRRLFFDARLSENGRVSCATCHDPARAFSDGVGLSRAGVSGNALVRHAPSLWNVAWAEKGLFWDGGSKNLESLSLAPLTHPDEMGRANTLDVLLEELVADAAYPQLFENAFGSNALTLSSLLRALAQFQRQLVAADARWDARRDTPLSADEQPGEQVFARHCARCHVPGLFTDGDFHNNGLDADFVGEAEDPRQGRGRVSLSAADRGKYKTPSLRDLERSAPYMHDGRFATLEQVIDHYRHGMVLSASIDLGFLRDGQPGVSMSDVEAAQLQAFLSTLSERNERADLHAPHCDAAVVTQR